ncbi:MAG: SH3 domain-containing protein [Candidatus Aminicenantales bacterium]
MRKISIFLAVFIIAAVGLHAQEMKTLRVKVQVANVRAEPDMNGAVVKQVSLGALLESRQKIGDWFEIMVTDDKGAAISGYINSSAVDVVGTGGSKAAAGAPSQETPMLRVKVQVANVRAEPDMNGAIVKQVNLGMQLEFRQKIGDWFEITVTDDKGTVISGYIHNSVVDVVGPGGAKPAIPTVTPPPVQTVTPLPAQTVPPQAPATEVQGRWPSMMIFGRYGSFSPSDENFKSIYGSGSVFGGEFRVHVVNGFFVSLEGGAFKKTGALTVTQEETTMTLYPIDAMVVFHALSGYVLPYVGAGGAVCKYTEENVIGKVDKWGFGFAVCGGVTARWRFLGIDARVKYTSIKIKPLEDEAGLGGLTISFAAGVVF